MHTTDVKLVSEQNIRFAGKDINMHDIKTIILDGDMIVSICVDNGEESVWLTKSPDKKQE